jgi:large subunit ribosomal protein L7/L12
MSEALETRLRERLAKIKARLQNLEAKKRAKASKAARAADTRRKILIGSMLLADFENNAETKARLLARLDKYLTRDDDRALFDLSPSPPSASAS